MAAELFIPKLGQTVEEVVIIDWTVQDGDTVEFGQPVLEVETDKAVFPLEANARGIIHLGPFKPGDSVPVLEVVAVIGAASDRFASSHAGPVQPEQVEAASPVPAVPTPAEPEIGPQDGESKERLFVSPRARRLARQSGIDPMLTTPTGGGGTRVVERDVRTLLASLKATPVAQRMAAEAGVDLRQVSGTGPGGRIIKEDIARAIASQPTNDAGQPEILERIPLKGVRAIIAERMAASVHTGARVTLVTEADATEFVAARNRIKAKVEQDWGFAPGYTDLMVKIVAVALRRFPYINARLAADAIEILRPVNVGIAVDSERGLLVPVIRDADRLDLRALGLEMRRLVEAARNGRSAMEDLTGGTFTITNLGMYEIDAFTPVINLPEAAILGVGRIAPKIVPFHGEAVTRQMLTLSLAFDHRLTDGAPAARFLQAIKQIVEEPYLLLTS